MLRTLIFIVAAIGLCLNASESTAQESDRPNILWITYEDSSRHVGAYGDEFAQTPHIDAFAKKSIRFTQAWANSPVCAPSRTTLITGQYASSLGAEHMRSSVKMEKEQKLLPEILRDAGYFCTNSHKEDYNLELDRQVWDESNKKAHWRHRKSGQPFFAVFNLGVTHESGMWTQKDLGTHDPSKLDLPPYYPDHPAIREALARNYQNIHLMDAAFQRLLDQLKQDGLENNTIVFLFSDHGSGMPRHKRWLYEGGLRVPMLAHFPEKWKHLAPDLPGKESLDCHQLVSFVDLAPTMLSLANIEAPDYLQGAAFAGVHRKTPRSYAFGFRGRMDEIYDFSRSVTDGRYVYIRNYVPEKPQGLLPDYAKQNEGTVAWFQLFQKGQLNEVQSTFFKPKSFEEFYDLQKDPHQINNLVSSSNHPMLSKLRATLDQHMLEIRDLGFIPESIRKQEAGDKPMRSFYADDVKYPLVQLMQIARQAADLTFSELQPYELAIKNPNASIQYWGVVGLTRRMLKPTAEQASSFIELAEHGGPTIRILAASALTRSTQKELRKKGINILVEEAGKVTESYFTSLDALEKLVDLGDKTELPWAKMSQFQTVEYTAPKRYADYYKRYLSQLLNQQPDKS